MPNNDRSANFTNSEQAKKAQEEIKKQNKRRRADQKALAKAADLKQLQEYAKKFEPYEDLLKERAEKQEQKNTANWQTLKEFIDSKLLKPEAVSYVEWRTGMMNLANGAGLLNKALFDYNLHITDVWFYATNLPSILPKKKHGVMTAWRNMKEFFGETGMMPKNFDPVFSMHAKMDNGRAFGQLFTGEDAEEVLFNKSNVEPTMPDMFLAGFLKENTDYEMVLDPQSPMFRKVVLKDGDKSAALKNLLNNPNAVKQIRVKQAGNVENYEVKPVEFKRNEQANRFILVAQLGDDPKQLIEIDVNHNDLKDYDQREDVNEARPFKGCFTGSAEVEVNGEVVTYEFELPKGEQLTSQEELDDQLGDDFLAYCQKKINEKAVGFNVQMNFKVDEDGNYEPEVYKIVNGKGTPIESDALNTTIDDTIQDYIDNQTPPKTLSKDGNKICKYVMPDPSNFKDEIIEKFSETQGAAVLSLDMNNRKLKIYHEGIEEPSELDLDFKISNQGGELKPKLVYTGTDGVEEEMVLESKELDKEPLTAKELNEAFKARLELDISKAIKDVSDEINKGDITLRAYNPNASSTLAPKP